MPRYLVERVFQGVPDLAVDAVVERNADDGVTWFHSYISEDGTMVCLYEAPNAEAIRVAARRLNVPADVIIEVSEVRPEMFA